MSVDMSSWNRGYQGWLQNPSTGEYVQAPASYQLPQGAGWMPLPSGSGQGGNTPIGQQGWQGTGLGWNLGTAQLGVQGLTSLGNLWNSWQANQLAQNSFEFQKGMAERNLANSIASYNTQLADRARARGAYEGQSADQVAGYIAANRLPGR